MQNDHQAPETIPMDREGFEWAAEIPEHERTEPGMSTSAYPGPSLQVVAQDIFTEEKGGKRPTRAELAQAVKRADVIREHQLLSRSIAGMSNKGLGRRYYKADDVPVDFQNPEQELIFSQDMADPKASKLKKLKVAATRDMAHLATKVMNPEGRYLQPITYQGVKNAYENGQVDTVGFGRVGALPGDVAHDVVAMIEAPELDRPGFSAAFGSQGTPAIFSMSKTGKVQEAIENQYSQLVNSIRNTLGSRTDKNYWDGKIESTKMMWDIWIEQVKHELAGLTGNSEPILPAGKDPIEIKPAPFNLQD